MTDPLTEKCADALYDAMDKLPRGAWVHGDTFLPANVLCDFHGMTKFKQLLADTVRPFLEHST